MIWLSPTKPRRSVSLAYAEGPVSLSQMHVFELWEGPRQLRPDCKPDLVVGRKWPDFGHPDKAADQNKAETGNVAFQLQFVWQHRSAHLQLPVLMILLYPRWPRSIQGGRNHPCRPNGHTGEKPGLVQKGATLGKLNRSVAFGTHSTEILHGLF